MGRMDSTTNVGILVEQVVTDIAKAHPQVLYQNCFQSLKP